MRGRATFVGFDAAQPIARAERPGSTHGLGLGTAIELARACGDLPERLVVFAVEARSFGPGGGLSPSVAAALSRLERLVKSEIRRAGGAGREPAPARATPAGAER